MTEPLDVLLLESHPWVGEASAATLTEAGHRVHRCHRPGDTGYACVGLDRHAECPLEHHVDAAVVVRAHGTTAPTPFEDGVRCAVRAGVPVVEVGERDGDPFAEWITLRAEERSLSAACRAAVGLARQPLVEAVLERVSSVVVDPQGRPAEVGCTIDSRWPDLDVRLTVAGAVDRRTEQAMSVRAYDALRPHTGTYRTVNVTVHEVPA